MKIDLPTENWNDIFGFLPRTQLAQLVPQIGDRHFASKAQFYLHDCGKITLGSLEISSKPSEDEDDSEISSIPSETEDENDLEISSIPSEDEDDPEISSKPSEDEDDPEISSKPSEDEDGPIFNIPIILKEGRELPLADVPIPANIKNFKQLRISYENRDVHRFLKEFQRNSLFDNANLNLTQFMINFDSDHFLFAFMLMTAVPVMPLFNNLDSISIDRNILPRYQDKYVEFTESFLASPRILVTHYNSRDEWYCDWLKTTREDGKPRVLCLIPAGRLATDREISPFVEHIKKDFSEAKEAISFFINLQKFRDGRHVQPLTLDNGETNEKLVVEEDAGVVTISRHPMGANEEWIKEMAKYEPNEEYRNIRIDFSSYHY